MATDQIDQYDDQPGQEPPKKSGGSGCLTGCLIAFVVVVVLIVIAYVVISRNWRNWMGAMAPQVVQQMMESSGLPEQEQAEILEQVDRVAESVKENEISMEQFQQLVERIVESPIIPSFLVSAVEEKYLNDSGLSDDEKADARVTLNRFIQGMLQKKFNEQEMEDVMSQIAEKQADGNWQLRDQVSDDQLRAMLAEAKQKADEAEIPEQVEEVDPSDKLRQIIDETLQGEPGESPRPAEPAAEPAEQPADEPAQPPEPAAATEEPVEP